MSDSVLFVYPFPIKRKTSFGEDLISAYFKFPVTTFAQLAACIPKNTVYCYDKESFVKDSDLKLFNKLIIKCKFVVFSIIDKTSYEDFKEISTHINDISKGKDKIIIAGGYYTFFNARTILKETFVKYLILGEAEISLEKIITAVSNKTGVDTIKNIAYQKEGELYKTKQLPVCDFPYIRPDYSVLDFSDSYSVISEFPKTAGIEISRGCVFNCTFCLTRKFWGKSFRRKNNNQIVDEVSLLVNKYDIRNFWFFSSAFGYSLKEDIELCDMLMQLPYTIFWRTSLRADFVLENVSFVEKAAKAGLRMVLVGFEGTDLNYLRSINKYADPEKICSKYKQVYKILHDNGILVEASIILGPKVSFSSMISLPFYLERISDHAYLSPYRPFNEKERANINYTLIHFVKRLNDLFYYFFPVFMIKRLFNKSPEIRRLYWSIYRHIFSKLRKGLFNVV